MMNKICAIDTETTSVDLMTAEAVELSIVPLHNDYKIDINIRPLELIINPGKLALDEGSEALSFNKIGRDYILKDGIPKEDVRGYIKGWMGTNNISTIIPLAHNWVFDRIVLTRLIGTTATEKLIYRRAKDSHSLAVAINDRYELFGKKCPFAQTRLGFLAEYFGFSSDGAHRAKYDCMMTAQVYRKLLEFPLPEGDKNEAI